MDVASIFEERKTRILRAVSFESADRVPVVLEYAGFAALVTDTPMAEFVSTPARATQTMIEAFRRLVNEVLDSGLIPLLHLDSNWERELGRFREFPKGKIIMALDGETDIFRAREILGDHMCLMGDVPAALFAFGSPAEVYNYSRKLIREIGPEGFILQSGCDIPANAKLENVQAMVAAAMEK